jgi:hypothetical protein
MEDPHRKTSRDETDQSSPGGPADGSDLPPAGPHADPALTREEATPGAGTLPPSGPGDGDTGDAASS